MVSRPVFEDQLTLDYFLPEKMAVEVKLYSLLGRETAVLLSPETEQAAGRHRIQLDRVGQNLPVGVYFLRFNAGNFQQSIHLVRAR